ncbi:2-deoxy-5-keto-D-gluconate 6-phosphate aldolase domain-containing protein [Xenorhabdus poinarii]|uniref:2-deoxy-5-keto-D-gluconate 6-phosphate aldolase domain-containing protein n=1 Tax=Xenorhabdus poinarii TaxID=40577 RepID=UPI0005F9FC64|nr:DUF2090 domain-containing protein [Xenorhabdus poinarii]
MQAKTWDHTEELIIQCDPGCRGVVIFGLDAPKEVLKVGFAAAKGESIVKGFAVGRTLFGKASLKWLANEIDDRALILQIKTNFHNLINDWRQREKQDEEYILIL